MWKSLNKTDMSFLNVHLSFLLDRTENFDQNKLPNTKVLSLYWEVYQPKQNY